MRLGDCWSIHIEYQNNRLPKVTGNKGALTAGNIVVFLSIPICVSSDQTWRRDRNTHIVNMCVSNIIETQARDADLKGKYVQCFWSPVQAQSCFKRNWKLTLMYFFPVSHSQGHQGLHMLAPAPAGEQGTVLSTPFFVMCSMLQWVGGGNAS